MKPKHPQEPDKKNMPTDVDFVKMRRFLKVFFILLIFIFLIGMLVN